MREEMLIEELEMSLERLDSINIVQQKIRELSLSLKNNKNKDLDRKFNNLLNYFRKVYLG